MSWLSSLGSLVGLGGDDEPTPSPTEGKQGDEASPDLEKLQENADHAKQHAEEQRKKTLEAFKELQQQRAAQKAARKAARDERHKASAASGGEEAKHDSQKKADKADKSSLKSVMVVKNKGGPTTDFGEFPPPEGDSDDLETVVEETFPLTTKQFFELFLADDAVLSMAQFHKLRNDKDVVLTNWAEYKRAEGAPEDPRFVPGTLERTMTAKMEVDGSYTRLNKIQRVFPLKDGLMSVTRAVTPDVIFGGEFSVTDIWELREVPGERKCHLKLSLGGYFYNYGWSVTLTMPIITSRIKTEGKAMWENWRELAVMTVSALADELNDDDDDDDDDDDADK